MTVALANAASTLCVFLRTRRSEGFLLLTVLFVRDALEPCLVASADRGLRMPLRRTGGVPAALAR